MATFSTLEALKTLSTSIPDWNVRLDELNGQIALRQIELARLTENERPPTRSIKNKGSTESLRPNDGLEGHFSHADENADAPQLNPIEASQSNGCGTTQQPTSSAAARAAAVVTPPPPKDSPDPRPSPNALARQSSQPTPPTQARLGLRKRKTDSLASAESNAPKYRTRSMIIVYYDSAVQTAFEELVKFVSGSRNSMRKGKMNAKMAAMRRAAEREVDDESEEEALNALLTNSGNLLGAQKNVTVGKEGKSYTPGNQGAMDVDEDDVDFAMPQLKFVSTRNMGPPRGLVGSRVDNNGSKMSTGMLGRYGRGRAGTLETKDIFDELDKGLEWCQGQCERAAHQFLRDGDCSDEIESIKRKLLEVKESAEKETEKLKKEEEEAPLMAPKPKRDAPQPGKSREMRSPQMRRDIGTLKDLEVDKMEVDDDEGVDDLELPPMLVFKRSRDIGR